ncbi:MAG: UDP-4-amino-4,6-dideoxy-N-acetyl-beta-L-altrosamine N-acetyltransferase [Nitrospiria bacterium]
MPLPESADLTPISESDLERVLEWRNAKRIRANMFSDHLISMEEHKAWFEKLKKDEFSTFLIFRFQKKPIGIISISQWDKRNQTCFWGFYIGEPDAPKGCGTFMGFLGLEYIFKSLKVRKVCGEVFAFNSASIRFHQKLGFVKEGRFKEFILKNGKYEDVLFFSLFQKKWTKLKPEIEKQCFKSIKG